jgi:D-threo-aldose 1-dehydrogenase
LPTKTLGRTGVELTTVGMGCAWMGADAQGNLDEEAGVRTILTALEYGVRFLDTAQGYMNTRSEAIVGRALAAFPERDRVVVQTKIGQLPNPFSWTADAVLRAAEGSFERLGVGRIELLCLHDVPVALLDRVLGPGGALEGARKLREQVLVGHVGIANNLPEDNWPYIRTGEFEFAVVPEAYSLLNQTALAEIFPAAERLGMGVVVAVPLEKGLLATGARAQAFYPGRRFSPEVLAHVDRIEALCRDHDVSLLAAALQYLTRHPVVAASIPGARTPEEARANATAAREAIPEPFWRELAPLVKTWDLRQHRQVSPPAWTPRPGAPAAD